MGVLASIQDESFSLESTPILPQQQQVFLFACVQLSQNGTGSQVSSISF